jgi:hypothetical protein
VVGFELYSHRLSMDEAAVGGQRKKKLRMSYWAVEGAANGDCSSRNPVEWMPGEPLLGEPQRGQPKHCFPSSTLPQAATTTTRRLTFRQRGCNCLLALRFQQRRRRIRRPAVLRCRNGKDMRTSSVGWGVGVEGRNVWWGEGRSTEIHRVRKPPDPILR